MSTLNNISERVAFSLGGQFNDTIKEAIKHTVINYRAILISQDLDRNFVSYTDYLQSFVIEFIKVDWIEGCDNCKILRSKNKVPKPLDVKRAFGKSNFKYVGEVTTNNAYVYAQFEELKFIKDLQYQHGVIYYSWDNGYLYLLNNLKLCKGRVEAIWADPRDINMTCEEKATMFSDDRYFPISEKLLSTIEKGILNGEFPIIKDGGEVKINPDNKTE